MLTMLYINDLNGCFSTVRGFLSVLLAAVKHEVSEIHAHMMVICLRAVCLGDKTQQSVWSIIQTTVTSSVTPYFHSGPTCRLEKSNWAVTSV